MPGMNKGLAGRDERWPPGAESVRIIYIL